MLVQDYIDKRRIRPGLLLFRGVDSRAIMWLEPTGLTIPGGDMIRGPLSFLASMAVVAGVWRAESYR